MDDCDAPLEKQLQATDNIDQVKEGVQLVFSKLAFGPAVKKVSKPCKAIQ